MTLLTVLAFYMYTYASCLFVTFFSCFSYTYALPSYHAFYIFNYLFIYLFIIIIIFFYKWFFFLSLSFFSFPLIKLL